MMKDRLLKALLFMLLLAAPCLAQTPEEMRRRYGQPKILSHKSSQILVEQYRVGRDIMITVKYADGRRACELRVEARHDLTPGGVRADVIPTDEAYRLTEELSPTGARGRLIKSSNAEFGCSSVVYNEYEHVMIAVANRCTEQSGGTYSVTIRWKDRACEQIDRKASASTSAGKLE
jgi:hypothetical protein